MPGSAARIEPVFGQPCVWALTSQGYAAIAAELCDRGLPAQPIITAATARLLTGTSYEAARLALLALEGAGVVRQISGGTYDRTYAADELFELIRTFELRLSGRATTHIKQTGEEEGDH